MSRIDGTKIEVESLKRIEPYVMKRRSDAFGFLPLQYPISQAFEFIEKYNQNVPQEEKLKLFHVILCALIRLVAMHPETNRFIAGRKLWQRNEIAFSFVVKQKLAHNSPETLVKLRFSPFETLETTKNKILDHVNKARSATDSKVQREIAFFGKFPRFMLMFLLKMGDILEFFGKMPKSISWTDPLYATAVIANLGSIGVEGGAFHHLYNYGTASFFVTIGQIRKGMVIDQTNGDFYIDDVIDFGFTLDERAFDAFVLSKVLKDFKHLIGNPELLVESPNLSMECIKELRLKDLNNDPLYQTFIQKNPTEN
jgi:hypothetical protein